MILLHRITSFAVAFTVGLLFFLLTVYPNIGFGFFVALCLIIILLFARLLKWEIKRFSFWVFFGTPVFFVFSSLFLFLFLELNFEKILLSIFVTLGAWLYAENIFAFYHLPSAYQPYALEYLSLVLYVGSGFFFTGGAYGAELFLHLPVWVPAIAVFWSVLFATMGVLWVSKVAHDQTVLFAVSGALLMTELYMMIAMLPTSFIVNAAAFSVLLYLFLGLSRAHVLDKLSKPVLQRYVGIGALMLIAILVTAKWV